jgi:hypothetical protein
MSACATKQQCDACDKHLLVTVRWCYECERRREERAAGVVLKEVRQRCLKITRENFSKFKSETSGRWRNGRKIVCVCICAVKRLVHSGHDPNQCST